MDDFERKIYPEMLRWKAQHEPCTALALIGPHGVGKTTLASKLAHEAYGACVIIDCNSDQACSVLQGNEDVGALLARLQRQTHTPLIEHNSLIVFDDFETCAQARQALEVLLRDGRVDCLITGCEPQFVPEQTDVLHVRAMDFEEFLWARFQAWVGEIVREHFSSRKPMESLHRPILKAFCEYVMTGGMPQAVQAFGAHKDIQSADAVKQAILARIRGEMRELGAASAHKAWRFFEGIASELAQRNKCYVLTHLDAQARWREYRAPIRWLEQTGNICVVRPLEVTDCAPDDRAGMLAQNAVAQALITAGHKPRFFVLRNAQRKKVRNRQPTTFIIR